MSAITQLLPTVGAAAGTAIGGPVGGMIGNQLGGALAGEIDKPKGTEGQLSVGILPNKPCVEPWQSDSRLDWPGGLKSNGRDQIDTGRYLVHCSEGKVKIFDKQSNTWVEAWGDPHLRTSDGDKASFTKDSLTIDLPDGTKVTMKPTKVENGVAFLDSVAVTQGQSAVEVTGLDPRDCKTVKVGNALHNADALDAKYEDGTVMRAGAQVDDLTYAGDGSELVGTDPNGRWGEHNLDGKGGTSLNSNASTGASAANGASGSSNAAGAGQSDWSDISSMIGSGASIASILMAIMQKLEKGARSKIESYKQLSAKYDDQQQKDIDKQNQVGTAEAKPDAPETDKSSRINEGDLKTAMMGIQEIQNLIQQLSQTASNIQKAYHDSNMTTVQNLK